MRTTWTVKLCLSSVYDFICVISGHMYESCVIYVMASYVKIPAIRMDDMSVFINVVVIVINSDGS